MIDPTTMFREGGPYMYALLLIAMALPVAVLGVFVARAMGVRVPLAVPLAVPAFPLAVGLWAVYGGFGMALDAVAHASAEMVPKLAAMGLSVGLYPGAFGATLAAVTASALAVAVGVGNAIGAGPDPRLTWTHAVAPALLGVLSLAGLVAGAWLGALVAGGALLGLTLASLRLDPLSPTDADRVVSGRVQAGVLALFAVSNALVVGITATGAWMMQVQVLASLEMRAVMLGRAVSEGTVQGVALVALIIVVGIAAVASVAPVARHLFPTRAMNSAGVALLVLLPLGGLSGLTCLRGAELWNLAQDPAIERLEDLQAAGIELPLLKGEAPEYRGRDRLASPTTRHLLQLGGPTQLDGRPVAPSSFMCPEDTLLVAANAKTPLRQLQPFAARCEKFRVALILQDADPDAAFRALDVSVLRADGDGAVIDLLPAGDGRWALAQHGPGPLIPMSEVGSSGLVEALSALPGTPKVHVWFPESASVQDLIDVLAPVRALDVALTWRIDASPTLIRTEDLLNTLAGGEKGPSVEATLEAGTDDVEIAGTLDRAAIDGVVKRTANQIRYCYHRELAKKPTLQGGLSVAFVIGADGKVASAKVATSTLDNDAVEACVVGRFQRMVFPAPPGGGIVAVTYPFVFAPG